MAHATSNGKVVVLTGATSGFGKGSALELARQGAKLALIARRGELLEELARECRDAGAEALAVEADVSSREDVERAAARVLDTYGRIDVWVNNAGVGALGPFEGIPLEVHEQVVQTNLIGTIFGSFVAYRQFLTQESGVLINIASELGYSTVPYYSSYAASKHGVVGLSDSLRQEVKQTGRDGIHICTIMPTAHDTPFFDHAANYTGHEVAAPKPLHDPQHVVDAIVRIAANPEDKEIVGGDGVVKFAMANVLPRVAEKMGAKQMHKMQMVDPPPAGDTPGAVLTPIPEGTEVRVGRKGGDTVEDRSSQERPGRSPSR